MLTHNTWIEHRPNTAFFLCHPDCQNGDIGGLRRRRVIVEIEDEPRKTVYSGLGVAICLGNGKDSVGREDAEGGA